MAAYRLFWYQVLTCVSVRLRAAARSMRSCTLRYFCRSKLLSSWLSWWSVKAVRALRGFFVRTGGLSLLLEISRSPSSLVPIGAEQGGWIVVNHKRPAGNFLHTPTFFKSSSQHRHSNNNLAEACVRHLHSNFDQLCTNTSFSHTWGKTTAIKETSAFDTWRFLFFYHKTRNQYINPSLFVVVFQCSIIPPPGRTIISLIDPLGRPRARGESPGIHLFSHLLD